MCSAISAGVGARPRSRARVLATSIDPDRHLLQVARDADRPALVAEVTLELAQDRGHRERGEGGRPVRLEPVDRLQQAQRGDLHEVVQRLAATLVAPRKLARERQEPLDERFPRREVAVAVIALEKPPVLTCAGRSVSVAGRICSVRLPCAVRCSDRLHALPRSRCLPAPGIRAPMRCDGCLGRSTA